MLDLELRLSNIALALIGENPNIPEVLKEIEQLQEDIKAEKLLIGNKLVEIYQQLEQF